MNSSTPGLLVHHYLPEFTQTHIHQVSEAIQSSHPVIPFSSHLQSFPASGSFQISQFFTSKYWSFRFSISTSNEYSGLISFGWTGWISLHSKGLSRVFSNTTVQKHQFFGIQLCLHSNSYIHAWLWQVLKQEWPWLQVASLYQASGISELKEDITFCSQHNTDVSYCITHLNILNSILPTPHMSSTFTHTLSFFRGMLSSVTAHADCPYQYSPNKCLPLVHPQPTGRVTQAQTGGLSKLLIRQYSCSCCSSKLAR